MARDTHVTCVVHDKIIYRDEVEAQGWADYFNHKDQKNQGDYKLKPYKASLCGEWHIGHVSRKERGTPLFRKLEG